MTSISLITNITEIFLLVILGAVAHEAGHYFFGYIFGGSPYVSRFFLGILPTQIDYQTPLEMSPRQVKITGGFVYIFIGGSIVAAYLHSLSLLAFMVGGIGVSWTDLLATKYPEQWRRFTAGESISRKHFDN